ncbi:MAG: alginate lyase family protein [Terriglobales bacterium]
MKSVSETWDRVAQMDWEERRARLAQEISKRADLALYRCGLLSDRNQPGSAAVPGQFFFAGAELRDRISLLKEKLSGEVEGIVREADEICRHRFRLLGYENLDYGAEIDWHLDAVHGKRAPMKPWFKINFLDFDEAGDHKIIWELNRHQHLVTLAKAWRLTHDERYATEVQAQWYSWRRANPYPMGINWASSLEVAFRSLSWIWVLSLMEESVEVGGFRRDVIGALARNGRYISRYLSTYFSPNTHLLGEAVALFFIGTMFPEIAAASRWRDHGWRIALREAQRQVRPDGVYFEQSLYYHVYALDFFLHARILAERNGIEIPAEYDAVLQKMLDVMSAVSQAGLAEGFGDDDGGRVFNPRRNRAEYLTDPLAVGGILFRRNDLLRNVGLTEEAVWLFGERGSSDFDRFVGKSGKAGSASFGAGGIYVMGSGEKAPLQMIVDAGPQGTGRSGHGHADALSLTVAVSGRRWLVDPGTFCYVCEERDRFRGTAAHNSLAVDGMDQAVPDGPFAWKSIPQVSCEQWIEGESFTLFAGSHTGYMRLADPVLHRRHIFHLHAKFWLVRDVVEGRSEHLLEINWHFASDVALDKIANGFISRPKDLLCADKAGVEGLTILPVEGMGWTDTIEADSVSPAYGKKDPAPTLRFSRRAKLPGEHGTLLLPLAMHEEAGKLLCVRLSEKDKSPSVYCYEGQGGKRYMIFADFQGGRWSWNEWTSDARFLCFSLENGRLADLVFCEGREISVKGMPVLQHPRRLERFEWDRRTGSIFSSDSAEANSISSAPLESFTSMS